jgi:hypothetical protein
MVSHQERRLQFMVVLDRRGAVIYTEQQQAQRRTKHRVRCSNVRLHSSKDTYNLDSALPVRSIETGLRRAAGKWCESYS